LSLQPSQPFIAVDGSAPSANKMSTIEPPVAPLYIQRPPLFVYDPHATGLGGGLDRGWTTRTPLAYRKVNDARSIGQRLIVDRDGAIILDEIFSTSEQCRKQLERFADRSTSLFHEDTDVQETARTFSSRRLDEPNIRVDEPVLSLMSVEPSNYGSWLFRVLPKLLFLEKLGGEKLKVACWCPMPWQRNLLAFFGIGEDRIIDINVGACYEFREIYVPVVLNPVAYMSEDTLNFFRRTMAGHGIEARRERLIYISRQSRASSAGFANVRNFTDEPKMIETLQRTGFEIVEPELLTITEQVRLFASAAMVVGASGAGMFNTAFCASGTGVVDIEAFPHWLYAHCNYFASCGHAYGIAFGVADPQDDSGTHKRWTIDVDGVAAKIEHLRGLLQ
jgi:capsular polysaccharide biosynthesis protein